MCEAALNLIPLNSDMYQLTNEYVVKIEDGSTDEDNTDHVYREITHGWKWIEQIPHFWDADKGPYEWVKNIFGMDDRYPNAYMKASELFDRALKRYYEGKFDVAYERLGHLAHLIGDMTVPAHVHEDFHPAWAGRTVFPLIPGAGDDCYEDFWEKIFGTSEGITLRNDLSREAQLMGVLKFPDDVEYQTRRGNWTAGIYYLMYTTNQCADYFASDDCDGDTDDREGWMDYSGWPDSPRTQEDIEDNDEGIAGDTLWDRDSDDDGDLTNISRYSLVYGIRAIATLYKMFYEVTHPPKASVTIVAADKDDDGAADYKWVKLDVTYDCGAPEYYQDLEAQFRNGDGSWTDWMVVGAQPNGRRVSWILTDEDGTKKVDYRVRNLMGNITQKSAEIELKSWRMPQIFDYNFTAYGSSSVDIRLLVYFTDFTLLKYHPDNPSVDSDYYVTKFVSDFYLANEYNMILADDSFNMFYSPVIAGETFWIGNKIEAFSNIEVKAGEKIEVYVKPRNQAPEQSDDIFTTPSYFYGKATTGLIEIPKIPTAGGTKTRELFSDYISNEFFEVGVHISATYTATSQDPIFEEPSPEYLPASVDYGESYECVGSASKTAIIPWSTYWTAKVSNPEINYYMEDSFLFAKTKKSEPDMVIAVMCPIDVTITDPNGKTTGSVRVSVPSRAPSPGVSDNSYTWMSYSQVPGTHVNCTDVDGDGELDRLIIIDTREIGNYIVEVTPSLDAEDTDTFSIAISCSSKESESFFVWQDLPLSYIPEKATYLLQSEPEGIGVWPQADAGGPYFAVEGTSITLNASKSTHPEGKPLTYAWDLNDDQHIDTDFSSNSTYLFTPRDDWNGLIKVFVFDGQLYFSMVTDLIVRNSPPIVNVGPDKQTNQGEKISFEGIVNDLGLEDFHKIEWDFGDGNTAIDNLTPTHTYSEVGIYVVSLTVIDDDGGVGTDTLIVNVGFSLSIEPLLDIVSPGEVAVYSITLQNLLNVQQDYTLKVSGLDPNWYTLEKESVTLEPNQSIQIPITVSAPIGTENIVQEFNIIVLASEDSSVMDFAKAEFGVLSLQHNLDPYSCIISPENRTYSESNIPLIYSVYETVTSVSFCLDGQSNLAVDGNTTLADLTQGYHSITVYTEDEAGKIGNFEPISFTIEQESEEEFPWIWLIAIIAIVALVLVVVLLFKR